MSVGGGLAANFSACQLFSPPTTSRLMMVYPAGFFSVFLSGEAVTVSLDPPFFDLY
ncbi:hypothetical protein BN1221_04515c [Brenneria goodwinii]|uniref:Uncharacterized protein n=1 Tax=Brenneria goodwinii TaxID=1109412 RepID=A0A0G4K1M7_9GAMM|nr:hypothetical protein BN1221_04515c [Brenneria goodwinii]